MTAEEKRDTHIVETIEAMVKGLLFSSEVEESMISICEEYARQKCKQQRELCASEMNFVYDTNTNHEAVFNTNYEAVLNAPEPEFD